MARATTLHLCFATAIVERAQRRTSGETVILDRSCLRDDVRTAGPCAEHAERGGRWIQSIACRLFCVALRLNGQKITSLMHCAHDGLDGPALPVLPAPDLAPRAPLHRDDHRARARARRRAAPPRLRSGRASGRAAAGRQRSCDARACARSSARVGLRRDQPQLRLSVGARADRQLRRVPDGRAGDWSRDCVRAMRDAVALPVTVKHRIGLDASEDYGFVRDFVGTVADAGCDRVHRARAQRGAEGAVAQGEPRGAAAALRGRASPQARFPAISPSC